MSTWSVPHNFIHSTHELDKAPADVTFTSITSLARRSVRRLVTPMLAFSCITAAISSTMYGFNMSKLNTPYQIMMNFINSSYADRHGVEAPDTYRTLIWSIIMSAFVGAGAIGSFASGAIAEKFGRRNSLLFNNLLAFASAGAELAAYYTNIYELLIVGRVLIGLNAGISQGVVSLYIAEISPKQVRGAFLSLHQIGVVLGIVLGQVLSLEFVLGGSKSWHFLCAFSAVPCLMSTIMLPFCPESPRYLLQSKNDERAAKRALMKLTSSKRATKDQLEEIKEEEKIITSRPDLYENFRYVTLLTKPELRRSLLLSALLNISQQWSGINAIFSYSSSVFKKAGVDDDAIQYAIIGTGVINVVVTFISLGLIEKIGRRKLLLLPNCVLICSLCVLTVTINQQKHYQWLSYATICLMLTYVVGFGLGYGPLSSMITCETFEQQARPPAMSVIQSIHYLASFTLLLTFKFLEAALKEYVFLLFAGIVATATLYLAMFLPECSKRSVKEVVADIRNGWRWQPCSGDQEKPRDAPSAGDHLAA